MEAIRALFGEMNDMKSEISSFKSECARLNRNNSRLVVDNNKCHLENEQLRKENQDLKKQIEILGGTYVEKNSKNSSIPPTQPPLEDKIIQHTKSLREPSGKKTGGQVGQCI